MLEVGIHVGETVEAGVRPCPDCSFLVALEVSLLELEEVLVEHGLLHKHVELEDRNDDQQ